MNAVIWDKDQMKNLGFPSTAPESLKEMAIDLRDGLGPAQEYKLENSSDQRTFCVVAGAWDRKRDQKPTNFRRNHNPGLKNFFDRMRTKTLLRAQTFEEKSQASKAIQAPKEATVSNTHIRCSQGGQ